MKFTHSISLIFIFLLLTSCGENSDDDIGTLSSETKENKAHKEHVNNIFNNIPDPALISKIITESNLDYQPDLLNDPTKYSVYNDENKKSLNLGIYGTDLSYASMFEQTAMIHFKATQRVLALTVAATSLVREPCGCYRK